jgi:hypothetical protein
MNVYPFTARDQPLGYRFYILKALYNRMFKLCWIGEVIFVFEILNLCRYLWLLVKRLPHDGVLQWTDYVSERRSTIVLHTRPDTRSYGGTEPLCR